MVASHPPFMHATPILGDNKHRTDLLKLKFEVSEQPYLHIIICGPATPNIQILDQRLILDVKQYTLYISELYMGEVQL